MKNSKERIDFIADYLSSYQSKIQLLNSTGLFDEATHFELFAQEVCKLWYSKQFKNLNENTYNYPCVDLVAEDNSIFVQVGTTNNVAKKIKSTLEGIQKSKRPEVNFIKIVKFFMLDNASTTYLKNTTVGNLIFTKATDLITPTIILNKAKNDLNFQIALYDLLQKDLALKDDFDKLKEAIEKSKIDIKTLIDEKINDEYEIDRSTLVQNVAEIGNKNVVVLGLAGYGKSAVCKKAVADTENVLFARAEWLANKSTLNDIWGFNIKNVLNSTNSSFVIFIDSLEFIADSRDKYNLLPYLFEITKDFKNVRIIMSCRSTDYGAFIKLKNYDITTFEVGEVSETELLQVAKKYKVIQQLSKFKDYSQLLKCPLYINLFVTKITDTTNIKNENELRKYIWDKIICSNEIHKQIVNAITFERAKEFRLHISEDKFNKIEIDKLVSDNILIRNNSFVRLKYDLFEDICFERYFDEEFDKCQNDFTKFFATIDDLGRCVYRRYQIWIGNKLLGRDDRNNVLNKIVFSESTPQQWKKETMVGLIRSRFSSDFFIEHADKIAKHSIDEFIRITNLYGFTFDNSWLSKLSPLIRLTPFGAGRSAIIKIIYDKDIYKSVDAASSRLLKLFADFAKATEKDEETSKYVVAMLQYFLDKNIEYFRKPYSIDTHKHYEYAIELLKPIYQLSEFATEWIESYWDKIIEIYKGKNFTYAKDIIKHAISFESSILAKTMPEKLCSLAEMFWTYERPKEKPYFYGGRNEYHMESKFGLCENAEHFSNTMEAPSMSSFFNVLFRANFWKGIKWATDFINCAATRYQKKHSSNCFNYTIKFVDENKEKTFIGFAGMWVATSLDYQLPRVLSDLLYCLQDSIFYVLNILKPENIVKFANSVKEYIFTNSNNIALLSVVSNTGIQFQEELPGFALDLATNINLIHHEVQRKVHIMTMPLRNSLEKQIMEKVCVPGLENRYKDKTECKDTLQEYVFNAQLYGSKEIVSKCHKILDHLYAQIPNDKKNATEHLQVQKMDARGARIMRVDNATYAVMANLTGEAEKVVKNKTEQDKPMNAISLSINSLMNEYKDAIPPTDKCVEIIEEILTTKEKLPIKMIFDKHQTTFISFALKDKRLPKELREKYCDILLDGVNGNLTNSFGYLFEAKDCVILFEQLESDISDKLKNRIKRAMLECIVFRGQNGIILQMARYAADYLRVKQDYCKYFFYTIVKLAEDEMNHQKFNADYIVKNKKAKNFEFIPNKSPKLRGVDIWIEEAKALGKKTGSYESSKEEIIESHLYLDKQIDLTKFEIEKYDIRLMCYAFGCGININDKLMADLAKKVLQTMIDIWKTTTRESHEILDVHTRGRIEDFFRNELVRNKESSKSIISVMFDEVDFTSFTHDAIDFYQNVFFEVTLLYFDAHADTAKRAFLASIFEDLSKKMALIDNEGTKKQLSKSLAFYFPQYKVHDFSRCPSGYSIDDKEFINTQIIKYGSIYVEDILLSIRQLHVDKLLPEILISVRDVLSRAKKVAAENLGNDLVRKDYVKETALLLISKAFINFSEAIKKNTDLTNAFEDVLNVLCDYNFEEAAVILDEFRIH